MATFDLTFKDGGSIGSFLTEPKLSSTGFDPEDNTGANPLNTL